MSKAQEVGKRIAQARREKAVRDEQDVRPADIARALEVSGATVSDWESGKITPREDALAKLAAFLGVTPAYLRYGIRDAGAEAGGRTLPTKEELAAMAGATVGKPRTLSVRDLEREATAKHAAKKGGGRRA